MDAKKQALIQRYGGQEHLRSLADVAASVPLQNREASLVGRKHHPRATEAEPRVEKQPLPQQQFRAEVRAKE